MKTSDLRGRLRTLNAVAPLPAGYHYHIESNGGHGTPRVYALAIVRDDYQGGDWYDAPRAGGYSRGNFIRYMDGMIEGVRLLDSIKMLPREVKTLKHVGEGRKGLVWE